MATMLLRASVRGNGLSFGAARRVFQVQRRLLSSPAKPPGKPPGDAVKPVDSKPVDPKVASANASPSAVAPLPIWQRLGPLTTVAQAYGRSQRRRPNTTQFWSAVAIYLVADLSAQYIGGNDYDPLRTGRSLIIGGIAAIPVYKWHIFLSNNFNYRSRVVSIGAKIVFSQLVFTPVFNTFFFGTQALLSGDGIGGAIERVKNTVPGTFVTSAKFWPPFTAFSFIFVPMEYRAIFAGCIAVVWQTYLSFVNKRAELLEATMAHDEEPKTDAIKVKQIILEDTKLATVQAEAAA